MPEAKTIGGAVVLVLIIVGLYLFYRYRIPKQEDKEAADNFLNGLSDAFQSIIINIVANVDITKYTSLEDMEADLFGIAYDSIWEYVNKELSIAVNNKTISTLVSSLVTRDKVETMVQEVINKCGLIAPAETAWINMVEGGLKEAVELEERAIEENAAYENGTKELPEDFEMTEVEEPVEEIIPPVEEENPYYDENDISQEILTEEEVKMESFNEIELPNEVFDNDSDLSETIDEE